MVLPSMYRTVKKKAGALELALIKVRDIVLNIHNKDIHIFKIKGILLFRKLKNGNENMYV